jgi:hypothetical protein
MKRIIITIVGVLTPPLPEHEQREPGFIRELSTELHKHFPEFKPDAKLPMVSVYVEDVPDATGDKESHDELP